MGIEPTLSAWKAEALPLNYTRKISRQYKLYQIIGHDKIHLDDAEEVRKYIEEHK